MLTKNSRSPYVISPVTRFVANRAPAKNNPGAASSDVTRRAPVSVSASTLCSYLKPGSDAKHRTASREASKKARRSWGVCAGGKFAFQIRTCSSCEDEVWGRHHISTIGPHTHKREIQPGPSVMDFRVDGEQIRALVRTSVALRCPAACHENDVYAARRRCRSFRRSTRNHVGEDAALESSRRCDSMGFAQCLIPDVHRIDA